MWSVIGTTGLRTAPPEAQRAYTARRRTTVRQNALRKRRRMATINAVLGPLDTRDLGFTLSHEHVIVTSGGIPHVYPEFVDRPATIERAVEELSQAHAA